MEHQVSDFQLSVMQEFFRIRMEQAFGENWVVQVKNVVEGRHTQYVKIVIGKDCFYEKLRALMGDSFVTEYIRKVEDQILVEAQEEKLRVEREEAEKAKKELFKRYQQYDGLVQKVKKKYKNENELLKWHDLPDGKNPQINLWTYWQGCNFGNVKLMILGYDWGSINDSNPEMEKCKWKLKVLMRNRKDVSAKYYSCKYRRTDYNLEGLFNKCFNRNIRKTHYQDFFFSNLCLGYRINSSTALNVEPVVSDIKDFVEDELRIDACQQYRHFHQISSNPQSFLTNLTREEVKQHQASSRGNWKKGAVIDFKKDLTSALYSIQTGRHSCRWFDDKKALSIDQIGNICNYAYSLSRHAVPSGGALYPLRIYCIISRPQVGADVGYYEYDNENECFIRYNDCPDKEQLKYCFNDESLAYNSGVQIVISADLNRQPYKYSNHGYRLTLIEVGQAAQNISLYCEENGIATCELGGILDDALATEMGIKEDGFSPILGIAIGYPSSRSGLKYSELLEKLEKEFVGENKTAVSFDNADEAMNKAFNEAEYNLLLALHKPIDSPPDINAIKHPIDHGQYYHFKDNMEKIKWVWENSTTTSVINKNYDINDIISKLEVKFVDLSEAPDSFIKVVRAVSKKTIPISFGYKNDYYLHPEVKELRISKNVHELPIYFA